MIIRRSRNPAYLFAGFVSLSFLGYFTNTFVPESFIHIGIFLILITLSSFFITAYLLNSIRQSILVSLGITGVLILRYLGLRQISLSVMFIALIIAIEWYLHEP